MSGTKYVKDTNALISFFKGNKNLQSLIFLPEKLIVSIIRVIEYLFFSKLTQVDKDLFFEFLKEADIINLSFENNEFIENIVTVWSVYKLKLPDAIIASTTLILNAKLVTNDDAFKRIDTLKILNF